MSAAYDSSSEPGEQATPGLGRMAGSIPAPPGSDSAAIPLGSEPKRQEYATVVLDPPWPMPETGVTTKGETDSKGVYTAKSGRKIDGN